MDVNFSCKRFMQQYPILVSIWIRDLWG